MNTPTAIDNQESAHLEKLRTQISTDIETMHQKEASLREYEQRLRVLVESAHQNRVPDSTNQNLTSPGNNQASLDAEWEKYNRAHALLEAARRGLCDDRLAVKDREEKLHQREVDVARREAWVKLREHELEAETAAAAAAKVVMPEPKLAFTLAPFLAARNLLMSRKS